MSIFLASESFPDKWHRRNTSLEFGQISLVTNAVITPRPVPRGAKNGEGVFVADEDPFQGVRSVLSTTIGLLLILCICICDIGM